jgi:hypothetical protein
MMRINHAERLSIWSERFPKTILLLIKISTVFPVNTFIAGMDVTTAIASTKIKLTLPLIESGNNGMEMIPAIGNSKAK